MTFREYLHEHHVHTLHYYQLRKLWKFMMQRFEAVIKENERLKTKLKAYEAGRTFDVTS